MDDLMHRIAQRRANGACVGHVLKLLHHDNPHGQSTVGRAAHRARDVCMAHTAGSQGAHEYSPTPASVQRQRGKLAPLIA